MKNDPDELLKKKDKFRTKNIDPDGCLKIKELRQNWVIADKLLKGSMVIARSRVRGLPKLSNPGENRRELAILGRVAQSNGLRHFEPHPRAADL